MAHGFRQEEVDQLLVKCHRRCCICHRFCGVKIEIDHIIPRAEEGSDTIDNAIAVCFECHAEIHSYNDQHPRGRKFRPEEIRKHKEQWLSLCKNKPDIFTRVDRNNGVGPLQSLIDELEFNSTVAKNKGIEFSGCRFHDEQFKRAIQEGAVAILNEKLKKEILEAYVAMSHANVIISWAMAQTHSLGTSEQVAVMRTAQKTIEVPAEKISKAHAALLQFLSSEK